jgi:DNA polymerase-3 subunit alpha
MYDSIYWNTACLIVNSGSLEAADDKSTDYAKTAAALGDIISNNTVVSLVDINNSDFGFVPDVKNNAILFGMKALPRVNVDIINRIKANRPYKSIKDFMNKCVVNKSVMFSLIKAGAFDEVDKSWANPAKPIRIQTMAYYVSYACEPKSKLTLQNFSTLMQRKLLPESLDLQQKTFNFNKYLKKYRKVGEYYCFDNVSEEFFNKNFLSKDADKLEVINGHVCINQKVWDKIYKKCMDTARTYLKENESEVLGKLNTSLFQEVWNKYCTGSTSAWEMESLCFYHGKHELADVDTAEYGIVPFETLPEQPEVETYFKRGGNQIPIFRLTKIMGTVIAKDDNHSSISLLTIENKVVTVKFTREYYAMYSKQVSERQEDGTKKVMEKSWFVRGTKVMITGFRRDDTFVAKRYKRTPTHQLYKILNVDDNGKLLMTNERYDTKE